MTYEPKSEHRFTFGLWTVGNPGSDPFGEPVREQLSPVRVGRAPRRGRRVGRELPRQRPGADRRHAPHERDQIVRRLQEGAGRDRPGRADGDDQPVLATRSSTTARSPRNDASVRAYALQKTMRAIDLGVELGAKIYVFWGGREGVETDAAKDPLERSSGSATPSTSCAST